MPFRRNANPRPHVYRLIAAAALAVSLCGCEGSEEPSALPAPTTRRLRPGPSVEDVSSSAKPANAKLDEKLPIEKRTYGELGFKEWQRRFKDFGTEVPQAAESVPALVALVRDADVPWHTRRQAALVLGRIGPAAAEAVPALTGLVAAKRDVGSKDSGVSPRRWAAQALALFGPAAAPATPDLVRLLEDDAAAPGERLAALEALASIGGAHPEAIPAVVKAFTRHPRGATPEDTTRRQLLREAAADALVLLGHEARVAVPHLMRALGDSSESIRRKAAAALGAIGAAAAPAIERLVDALGTDESPAVRDAAASALAAIGPAALPVLRELAEYDDAEVRWRAIEAIGRIEPMAETDGDAELLDTALDDPDARVRIAAAEALWRLTGDASAVLPSLVEGLTNPARQIRVRAYRLLLELGPAARPAIVPLERLLEDDRPHVRRAAEEALRKLLSANDE
ncbi:MAG: HEAT repeat domain-containing protein [Planctomycetes bacterium]|nr:HEAT repeat domain-containing protein [Planctomycetota bacterium]